MASASDIAVILSEAAQIYYTGKAFEYQQIQNRQAQRNIEIDRQLQVERDDKAIQAEVWKSELQREGRALDELNNLLIQSQTKYQGLTGEIFKLPDSDKTESGVKVIGDIQAGEEDPIQAQLAKLKSERGTGLEKLSVLLSRINSIDRMRADIAGGAGGMAAGEGDPFRYDPTDFSYQEYAERKNIQGQPWLQKGYLAPTPAAIQKLNKDFVDYEYKQASTKVWQDKSGFDNAANVKAVDDYYKRHYQMAVSPLGLGELIKTTTAAAGWEDDEDRELNERYRQIKDAVVHEKLVATGKMDPLGFQKALKGYQMGTWGKDEEGKPIPFSVDDYIKYVRNDPDFMKGMNKGLKKNEAAWITFAERATLLNQWSEGVFKTHWDALQILKGNTGLQGSGEEILAIIVERRKQYKALIEAGDLITAKQLAFSFDQVTGVDVSDPNQVDRFRRVVLREGWMTLKDVKLVDLVNPKSTPGQALSGSDDEDFYKLLYDQWQENDTATSLDAFQNMTDIMVKKYGPGQVESVTLDW